MLAVERTTPLMQTEYAARSAVRGPALKGTVRYNGRFLLNFTLSYAVQRNLLHEHTDG
jgi:hypothetical protein